MGCDIVFTIKGQLGGSQSPTQLIISNSNLSKDDISIKNISELLYNLKDKKLELANMVKNITDAQQVSNKDIEQNGVVGNYKYHNLKYKYANNTKVTFPVLRTPYDPDILLVTKFNNKGVNGKDVVYKNSTTGEPIFVIEDSEAGVNRLNNYLKCRDIILNEYQDREDLAKLLPELAKTKKKFNSQKELLLDFLIDNSSYKDLLKNKGLYGLLSEIIKEARYNSTSNYTNPLDREFINRSSKNSDKYRTIYKKQFLDLVETFHPEIIKKSNGDIQKMFELFSEHLVDSEFSLFEVTNNSLIVKSIYSTLEDKYGFTYSTIKNDVSIDSSYRGFIIYKYQDKYFVSKDLLTPKSYSKSYSSPELAKAIIDQKYQNQFNLSYFEPSFLMIPKYERVNDIWTTKYHADGSIVRVLDIAIDRDTILDNTEAALFTNKKNLNDFFEEFETQLSENQMIKLKEVIDSIDEAGIFIYLLNERAGNVKSLRKLQENTIVEDILSEIQTAKEQNQYKYYFIRECIGSKDTYHVKMIPVNGFVDMDVKYDRPRPIIQLMNEVVDKFSRQFGVNAEVFTYTELHNMFPDIQANVKAFVREGKIYINGSLATSEDVIHEYTHLILGALKASNFEVYEKLLQKLPKDKHATNVRQSIKKNYPTLAKTDEDEEVFAVLFSEFLAGKSTDKIFEEVKEKVDDELKSIFTLASKEDFNKLYRGRVEAIFQIFSKDIGKVGNGLDFSKGTVYRQAANWISKQLQNENITEKC